MTAAGFGEPPRRLRGREAKAQAARAAQDAAVEAFYRMDRAQRDIAVQVEAYANIDADPHAAARLRQEFAALSAETDARAHRYLATLDAHPLDGEPSAADLDAAADAYAAGATDIAAMAGRLEAFAAANAGLFAQVGAALERVAARTGAAQAALADARTAMAALGEAGLGSAAASAALAEAESAAAELARGTAGLGVAGTLAAADRVAGAAGRAHALATDLPRRRAEVTKRLASIRTRREAIGHQSSALPEILRGLRRGYVEGCWADVADVGERVAEALAAADTELAAVAQAVREADWDGASAAVTRAVARLDTAADLVRAARSRPGELDEAKRDPGARMAAARFAVRDAQRLVMAGRSLPPMPWARELDALAARLDRAGAVLDSGVHPDYWAYLRELRAVTEATADLVARFRADPRG